jgi:cytochrome c-type biogenesis protein CcmE
MKKLKFKTLTAVLLIGIAVAYLMYQGVSDTGVYYRTVNEVINNNGEFSDRNIRISGKVVEGTIDYNERDLVLYFSICDLEDDTKTMRAVFNGVAPDAFQDGAEVILEGSYIPTDNTFSAVTLLAKCPSKYVSEDTST